MSRSGCTDEIDDQWQWIMYRGRVSSAVNGKRGQAFLLELIDALDAMPKKELISKQLVTLSGGFCALGAVGAKRQIDLSSLDPEDTETVAETFGIAEAMVREIVHHNDEVYLGNETPQDRWKSMRAWAVSNYKGETK